MNRGYEDEANMRREKERRRKMEEAEMDRKRLEGIKRQEEMEYQMRQEQKKRLLNEQLNDLDRYNRKKELDNMKKAEEGKENLKLFDEENQKISKPKKISKPNHVTNPSKYISYTNLCQKRNIDIVKKNQTCHTKSQITIMTSNSKTKSRNAKVDKLFSYISKHNTTTTTSKPKKPSHSNTKNYFKTFDLAKQNQKSTINTTKVKSLISHITKHVKNTSINLQIHKKSNNSIDGNANKSKPKKHISSISSIPTTKDNNKNIIKLRKSAKKAPQSSTNDELMKITLALLMNDKSKYTQSGKQIQNVNININNQININNNLQIPVPFSPKHINTKISHNDKVDMNINSNLTRLLSANKKSRNKTGSGEINANTYCSFNITDKKSNPTMKNVMKT